MSFLCSAYFGKKEKHPRRAGLNQPLKIPSPTYIRERSFGDIATFQQETENEQRYNANRPRLRRSISLQELPSDQNETSRVSFEEESPKDKSILKSRVNNETNISEKMDEKEIQYPGLVNKSRSRSADNLLDGGNHLTLLPSTNAEAIAEFLDKSTAAAPANIPLLVLKSYSPSSSWTAADEVSVKEGSVVNCLYKHKQWTYIRTSNDIEGFIPFNCTIPLSLILPKNRKSVTFQGDKTTKAKLGEDIRDSSKEWSNRFADDNTKARHESQSGKHSLAWNTTKGNTKYKHMSTSLKIHSASEKFEDFKGNAYHDSLRCRKGHQLTLRPPLYIASNNQQGPAEFPRRWIDNPVERTQGVGGNDNSGSDKENNGLHSPGIHEYVSSTSVLYIDKETVVKQKNAAKKASAKGEQVNNEAPRKIKKSPPKPPRMQHSKENSPNSKKNADTETAFTFTDGGVQRKYEDSFHPASYWMKYEDEPHYVSIDSLFDEKIEDNNNNNANASKCSQMCDVRRTSSLNEVISNCINDDKLESNYKCSKRKMMPLPKLPEKETERSHSKQSSLTSDLGESIPEVLDMPDKPEVTREKQPPYITNTKVDCIMRKQLALKSNVQELPSKSNSQNRGNKAKTRALTPDVCLSVSVDEHNVRHMSPSPIYHSVTRSKETSSPADESQLSLWVRDSPRLMSSQRNDSPPPPLPPKSYKKRVELGSKNDHSFSPSEQGIIVNQTTNTKSSRKLDFSDDDKEDQEKPSRSLLLQDVENLQNTDGSTPPKEATEDSCSTMHMNGSLVNKGRLDDSDTDTIISDYWKQIDRQPFERTPLRKEIRKAQSPYKGMHPVRSEKKRSVAPAIMTTVSSTKVEPKKPENAEYVSMTHEMQAPKCRDDAQCFPDDCDREPVRDLTVNTAVRPQKLTMYQQFDVDAKNLSNASFIEKSSPKGTSSVYKKSSHEHSPVQCDKSPYPVSFANDLTVKTRSLNHELPHPDGILNECGITSIHYEQLNNDTTEASEQEQDESLTFNNSYNVATMPTAKSVSPFNRNSGIGRVTLHADHSPRYVNNLLETKQNGSLTFYESPLCNSSPQASISFEEQVVPSTPKHKNKTKTNGSLIISEISTSFMGDTTTIDTSIRSGYDAKEFVDRHGVDASNKVIALYDFEALEEDDLSVKHGEILHVTNEQDAHWLKVKNKDGSEGYIPREITVELHGSETHDVPNCKEKLMDDSFDSFWERTPEGSSFRTNNRNFAEHNIDPEKKANSYSFSENENAFQYHDVKTEMTSRLNKSATTNHEIVFSDDIGVCFEETPIEAPIIANDEVDKTTFQMYL